MCIGEKKFATGECQIGFGAKAQLCNESCEAVISADTVAFSNLLVGGSQKHVIVRLGDDGQFCSLDACFLKEVCQKLQRARIRGFHAEHWVESQKLVELLLVDGKAFVGIDSVLI